MEIVLRLTLDEVNVLLTGAGRLPYVEVAPVVKKVSEQAQEQLLAADGAEEVPL